MTLKKKTLVIIISYLAAALAILSGFIFVNYQNTQTYKRYINNTYQHAFAELVTCINEVDSAMQKSLYATSPSMTGAVCTEIFGKTMSAQMAMGELPFSNYELEHTAEFITKLSDYAFVLSKNAAMGKSIGEKDRENLKALAESTSLLSDNLTQLYADIEAGDLTLHDLEKSQDAASATEDDILPKNLGESFKLMESEFPEIPSLIYDGPFSNHISQMSPRLVENDSEISENEAIRIAAKFTGFKENTLKVSALREGELPAYLIEGGGMYIEVTKQGGEILNLSSSVHAEFASIDTKDAVRIAERFLEKRGYPDMKTSYWTLNENSVTVNFAYTQNGVICYPDLIKVTVSLQNGGVTGFEALGFIMSHHERDIPQAKISADAAQAKISPDLKVLSHNMSIVPSSGKYEVFCHEFKCENKDGKHYIVYINAETGGEEKILILIEDENGTLTL